MGILDGEYDSYNWEYQENYRIYGRYIVCWLLMDYFAGYVPGLLGSFELTQLGTFTDQYGMGPGVFVMAQLRGKYIGYTYKVGPPNDSVQLVQITPIIMVYGTYNYS